jgi:hypothetical protein
MLSLFNISSRKTQKQYTVLINDEIITSITRLTDDVMKFILKLFSWLGDVNNYCRLLSFISRSVISSPVTKMFVISYHKQIILLDTQYIPLFLKCLHLSVYFIRTLW